MLPMTASTKTLGDCGTDEDEDRRAAKREPSSTEALRAAGYTHRSVGGPHERHEILDASGAVVANLHAREVWAWLREVAK